MSSPIQNYLRTKRREWALTQKELAYLLGRKSPAHISRVEQGSRKPQIDIALGGEVLFGLTPEQLFPTLYADIEESVLARAATLYEKLDKEESKIAERKKMLLTDAMNRAVNRLNQLQEHES